jgi:hypothetical protein
MMPLAEVTSDNSTYLNAAFALLKHKAPASARRTSRNLRIDLQALCAGAEIGGQCHPAMSRPCDSLEIEQLRHILQKAGFTYTEAPNGRKSSATRRMVLKITGMRDVTGSGIKEFFRRVAPRPRTQEPTTLLATSAEAPKMHKLMPATRWPAITSELISFGHYSFNLGLY